MNKVYLVTNGDNYEYEVYAVFNSLESSEYFVKAYKTDKYFKIEEKVINLFSKETRLGYKFYFLRITRDGEVYDIENSNYYSEVGSYGFSIHNSLYLNCIAKDEEHATKLIKELRIKLLNENNWK